MNNVIVKDNSILVAKTNTVYYVSASTTNTVELENEVTVVDINVASNLNTTFNISDIATKHNIVININISHNSCVNVNYFLINSVSSTVFNINLIGEKAEIHFNSLVLARLKEKSSLVVNTNNSSKFTLSKTIVQCVLLENASVEVTANGHIAKGMKQARNHQKLIGLNEDRSLLKLNPILLIDEYDVEASHAASNGLPDENILFYLMSRGLSEVQAKLLLRESLINPFLQKLEDNKLKQTIREKIKGVFISE